MKYLILLISISLIIIACSEDDPITAESVSTITLGTGVDEQDSLKLTGQGTNFTIQDTVLQLYWRLKTTWLVADSPFDLTLTSPDSTWTTRVQGPTNFDNTFLGPFQVYTTGQHNFTLYQVDGNYKLGSINFTVE